MRRLFFLTIVVLLGTTLLLGGRVPALAQEGSDKFEIITTDQVPWQQVSRPRPVAEDAPLGGGGTSPIEKIPQYEVYFGEESSAVPVIENAEFMLVAVQQGTFVLDLAPEGTTQRSPLGTFLVHPSGGQPIPIMTPTGYNEPGPYYVPAGGNVPDATSNGDCTSMCMIPVEVAVQVKPGDRIVAREGAICLWCLLNQTPTEGDEKGLLLVTPVVPVSADANDFSWIKSWDYTVASFSAQTQTVRIGTEGTESISGEPVKMGWALFNPASSCRG